MNYIIKRFLTNLNKHNKGWKLAWGVTAVACVVIAFKTTLLGNLIMIGCWLAWLPYIYFDWENS
jgi:hypothetical protein